MTKNTVTGRKGTNNSLYLKANGEYIDDPQAAALKAAEMALDPTPTEAIISAYDRILAVTTARHPDPATAENFARMIVREADEYRVPLEYAAEYHEARMDNEHSYRNLDSMVTLYRLGARPADAVGLLNHPKVLERQITSFLDHGLTPAKLDDMVALGVPNRGDAFWAFRSATQLSMQGWVVAIKDDKEFQTWLGDWNNIGQLVTNQIDPFVAKNWVGSGATPEFVARHGALVRPDEVAAFIRDSKLKVGSAQEFVVWNAKHTNRAIPAEVAAKWGPNFSPDTVVELIEANIEPKQARSIRAAEKELTASEIIALTNAGVTTGEDFKQWRDVLDLPKGSWNTPAGRVEKIVNAINRSGVTHQQAAYYKSKRFDTVWEWARLGRAGVTDLDPWIKAVSDGQRANGGIRTGFTMAISKSIDEAAEAGVTPERFRIAQRAGIPMDQVAKHAKTRDLWKAGEKYRQEQFARETADARTYSAVVGQPWAWNENTYKQV